MISRLSVCLARRRTPQRLRDQCFDTSPIDALIGIKLRCGLRCLIPVGCPVWFDLRPVIRLRITTVVPQRRPIWQGRALIKVSYEAISLGTSAPASGL
jgi:hypothetical protein